MLRLIINLVIKAVAIFAINAWGLAHLRYNGQELSSPLGYLAYAVAFTILFAIIGFFVKLIVAIPGLVVGVLTLGVGLLLLALVINAIVLWAMSGIMPSWVQLTGFWPTIGAGLLLGIGIPADDDSRTRR